MAVGGRRRPGVWAVGRAESVGSVGDVGLVGLAGFCLLVCVGCATSPAGFERDGSYRHPELGYRIALPLGEAAAVDAVDAVDVWGLLSVEGADLAFRQLKPEPGQQPALMALISECGRGSENLSIVARQLLIGLRDRALRQAAPLALRGSPGWMQVFDITLEGEDSAVRVKTISIRHAGCTFDWVLVAPGPFRLPEQQFDAWWSSFERPPDTPTVDAAAAESADPNPATLSP